VLNSSRVHLDRFAAECAASVPPGSFVLDAGAGDGGYRHHFAAHRYESADFGELDKPYTHLTYRCRLDAIPVEDDRYDVVLLSQVLEHLPEPLAVLRELGRVLKPGAALWLSAPLFYEEHEAPYDFYRYTQFGFRYLLAEAGFTVEQLGWLEGYGGTLSYQLDRAVQWLPRRPGRYGGGASGFATAAMVAMARPLFRRLAVRLAAADVQTPIRDRGMCKNYAIVARRVD
jgi:SAM-dependent methyltransferase